MTWTLTTRFIYPGDWQGTVGSTPTRKLRFQIMGSSDDATELSAQSILDISTLTALNGQACTEVAIRTLQYDVTGLTTLDLLFDRTTDDLIHRCVPGTNLVVFDPPVGDLAAGGTGDLFLTTSGGDTNSAFTLDIECTVKS